VAGRHAAGQTTRRIPLTREFIIRAAVPSTAEPTQPGTSAKSRRKAEYHARHALRRTRRPITPYAAAAITVTVVGATVGLAHTAAGTAKAGDLEPVRQAVKIDTIQAASRSYTRPSPRPSPSASAARKRIRAVLMGDREHKAWKPDSGGRVTNPRHGKPTSGHISDRDGHASDRDHDDS
jgi:hypothetical protein